MARVHGEKGEYFYEVDGFDIPLDEDTYSAFQHRDPEYKMMDWIGVLDERDGEHFSHFRFEQPPEEFNRMLLLVHQIGTLVIRNTPFDYIQVMFDNRHALTDEELEGFFDGQS